MMMFRGTMVLLLLAALPGCGKTPGKAPVSPPPTVQGATVTPVSAEAIPEIRDAVGTVRARSSALISARIAGSVSGVYVREGDRVGKGKVLAAIEAAESGAAAAGAAAGVEEARRALQEARSREKLAGVTYQRYRRLFEEQAVTRQEFDQRLSEHEVAAAGVAMAEARVRQATEAAKAAATVAGYGRVASPISGTVTAKQVEAGQTVFPGTPLFTVEGDAGYRLEAAAPEGLLGRVKAGDQVRVAVEGALATGRVSEVVPVVDPGSRTFTVKIDLSGRGFRSGSYGKALLRVGSRQGITVPAAAVVERGALTSVWVVTPERIARLRLVKLGQTLGDRVEVVSGVTAGDRVVTAGVERMSDGVRVQ